MNDHEFVESPRVESVVVLATIDKAHFMTTEVIDVIGYLPAQRAWRVKVRQNAVSQGRWPGTIDVDITRESSSDDWTIVVQPASATTET